MRCINKGAEMFLIKIGACEESKVGVLIEKIVEDLIMISVTDKSYDNSILSYWRLTNVRGIPPLEIGVNCEKQTIASIVFYVGPEHMCEYEKINVETQCSGIIVDTSIFSKTNDYVDFNQNYIVCVQEKKLVCYFAKDAGIIKSYKMGRLEIYINLENKIIGFAINDLSSKEVEIIQSI